MRLIALAMLQPLMSPSCVCIINTLWSVSVAHLTYICNGFVQSIEEPVAQLLIRVILVSLLRKCCC